MIEPRFSVIVPVFNREDTILECIDSVLNQTHQHLELIVIDDGSTDQTGQLIGALHDPRISYYRQTNQGVSAARNYGISMAKNEWIAFLDSDDYCDPDWLDSFASVIRAFKQCGYVSCGFKQLGDNGEVERAIFPERHGPMFFDQKLNYLAGTFCVRKDILGEVGGYIEELRYSENTELALRIVGHCISSSRPVCSTSLLLLHYRPSNTRESNKDVKAEAIRRLDAARYFLEHHWLSFERDPAALGNYLAIAGVNAGRLGRHRDAKKYLGMAIKTNPFKYRNYGRLVRELWRQFLDQQKNGREPI